MDRKNQPEVKLQIEQELRCTPLLFAATAELLGADAPELNFRVEFQRTSEKVIGHIWTPPPSTAVFLKRALWPSRRYKGSAVVSYRAELQAIRLPEVGTLLKQVGSLLKIYASDIDWAHIEPIWLALAAKLEDVGFLGDRLEQSMRALEEATRDAENERIGLANDIEVLRIFVEEIASAPPAEQEDRRLSAKDLRKLDYCKRAIEAKQKNGTDFADFLKMHPWEDGEITPRTFQRWKQWMRKLSLEWK